MKLIEWGGADIFGDNKNRMKVSGEAYVVDTVRRIDGGDVFCSVSITLLSWTWSGARDGGR